MEHDRRPIDAQFVAPAEFGLGSEVTLGPDAAHHMNVLMVVPNKTVVLDLSVALTGLGALYGTVKLAMAAWGAVMELVTAAAGAYGRR